MTIAVINSAASYECPRMTRSAERNTATLDKRNGSESLVTRTRKLVRRGVLMRVTTSSMAEFKGNKSVPDRSPSIMITRTNPEIM